MNNTVAEGKNDGGGVLGPSLEEKNQDKTIDRVWHYFKNGSEIAVTMKNGIRRIGKITGVNEEDRVVLEKRSRNVRYFIPIFEIKSIEEM